MILQSLAEDRILLNDTELSLSGIELKSRCDQLGEFLAHRKLTRIALLAENSLDWIVVDLACQQANICLVPIPVFFSPQQIRYVLETCSIQAVLSDRPNFLAELTGLKSEFFKCDGLRVLQLSQLPELPNTAALPAGTNKITFTSGSTGRPKGVCLSTSHLVQQAQRLRDEVAVSQPRHLCLLPLSTLLENIAGVYAPLLAQGEICVPRPELLGFAGSALKDPRKLLTQLTILQPNTLILIPQLLSLLVDAVAKGWSVPASLKFVAVGGARVAPQTLMAARAAGIPVYEGYGLSECAAVVSLNTPGRDQPGSCGKPLPGLNLTIADGEVVIEGSVMLGYLNDTHSWHQTRIASGDLGHIDKHGFLHISGRKKNVLISSYGRNISPEWVESELLANPAVGEAVVIGDALPFCSAFLWIRSGEISNSEIQAWIDQVNAHLPDYARIQKWVRRTEPLTANSDFVTGNGRLRRDHINAVFQTEIDRLYAAPEFSQLAAQCGQ